MSTSIPNDTPEKSFPGSLVRHRDSALRIVSSSPSPLIHPNTWLPSETLTNEMYKVDRKPYIARQTEIGKEVAEIQEKMRKHEKERQDAIDKEMRKETLKRLDQRRKLYDEEEMKKKEKQREDIDNKVRAKVLAPFLTQRESLPQYINDHTNYRSIRRASTRKRKAKEQERAAQEQAAQAQEQERAAQEQAAKQLAQEQAHAAQKQQQEQAAQEQAHAKQLAQAQARALERRQKKELREETLTQQAHNIRKARKNAEYEFGKFRQSLSTVEGLKKALGAQNSYGLEKVLEEAQTTARAFEQSYKQAEEVLQTLERAHKEAQEHALEQAIKDSQEQKYEQSLEQAYKKAQSIPAQAPTNALEQAAEIHKKLSEQNPNHKLCKDELNFLNFPEGCTRNKCAFHHPAKFCITCRTNFKKLIFPTDDNPRQGCKSKVRCYDYFCSSQTQENSTPPQIELCVPINQQPIAPSISYSSSLSFAPNVNNVDNVDNVNNVNNVNNHSTVKKAGPNSQPKNTTSYKYPLTFHEYRILCGAFYRALNLNTTFELYIQFKKYSNHDIQLLKNASPESIEFLVFVWFHIILFPTSVNYQNDQWASTLRDNFYFQILNLGLTIDQVKLFFRPFETCTREGCKYGDRCCRVHGPAQCHDQFSGCGVCSCASKLYAPKIDDSKLDKPLSNDGFTQVKNKNKQKKLPCKPKYTEYDHKKYVSGWFVEEGQSVKNADFVYELPVCIHPENLSVIHAQQLERYTRINKLREQKLEEAAKKFDDDIAELYRLALINRITDSQTYGDLVQGIDQSQLNNDFSNLLPPFRHPAKIPPNREDKFVSELKLKSCDIATKHGFTPELFAKFLGAEVDEIHGGKIYKVPLGSTLNWSFQTFMSYLTSRDRPLFKWYLEACEDNTLLPECRINGTLIWSACVKFFEHKFYKNIGKNKGDTDVNDDTALLEVNYDIFRDDRSYFFDIPRVKDPKVLGNMAIAPLTTTRFFNTYTKSMTTDTFYDWLYKKFPDALDIWEEDTTLDFGLCVKYIEGSYKIYGVGLHEYLLNPKISESFLSIHKFKLGPQSNNVLITWDQFLLLTPKEREDLVNYFYQGLSLLDKSSKNVFDAIKFTQNQCIEDGEYTKCKGQAPLCNFLLCSLSMLSPRFLDKFIEYTKNLTDPQVLKLGTINILVHPDSAPQFSSLASALLNPEFFDDEKARERVLSKVRKFWNMTKHETQLKFDDTPLIRDIKSQLINSTKSLFQNMKVSEITPRFVQALKKRLEELKIRELRRQVLEELEKKLVELKIRPVPEELEGIPVPEELEGIHILSNSTDTKENTKNVFIFNEDQFEIDDKTHMFMYLFLELIRKSKKRLTYIEKHMNILKEVIGSESTPLISDIRARFFTQSVNSDKPPKDNTKSKVTKKNIFYAGADDDSDSDNVSDSESDSDDSDSDESDSDSETEIVDQVIVSTFKPDTNSKFFGANDDDDDVKVVSDSVKVVSSEKEEKEHTGVVNLCRIVNKKFIDDKGETTARTGTLLVFKKPISEGKLKKINDELPSSCPRFHELLANDETNDQVFFMPYKGKDASVNTEIHYAIAKVLHRDVDSICVQGLEEETKVMVKKVEKAVVNIKPVPEKKLTGKAAWEAAQAAKAVAKEQAKIGANVNIKSEKAPRRGPPPSNKNKNTVKVSEEDEVDLSDMDLLDKLGY